MIIKEGFSIKGKKHAYLIMVHNNYKILEYQIKMLDFYNHDLYIHVDKKCKDFNFDYFKNIPKESNIYFLTDRNDVQWGHKSQIKTVLDLLRNSFPKSYCYYHLLSGVDLPLHSPNYLYNFFDCAEQREFVGFDNINPQKYDYRIKYYNFFVKFYKKRRIFKNIYYGKMIRFLIWNINMLLINIQKCFKVNRLKNKNWIIKKGSNWFSITHELVNIILNNEEEIMKMVNFSWCGDEMFLQTIFFNSNLYDDKYNSDSHDYNLRYTDWKRGAPYTFSLDDYEELLEAKKEYLFARKFDENQDIEIVELLYNTINL